MAPGALAIDLATVLMTTAAHAAPDRKDVQAPRGPLESYVIEMAVRDRVEGTAQNPFLGRGILTTVFRRRTGSRSVDERGGKRVKYMLLIYGDEKALDDIERKQCYVESTELAHDLHSAGQYLAAAPLHPTSRAISVRVRESKRLVTDGPFAETREQLGGYFLVEASDSDEAIDIASRIPMACLGTIEIRPVIEIPGLPKS